MVDLGIDIFDGCLTRGNTWIWIYFRSFTYNSKMAGNNFYNIIYNFSDSSYDKKSIIHNHIIQEEKQKMAKSSRGGRMAAAIKRAAKSHHGGKGKNHAGKGPVRNRRAGKNIMRT